MVVTAQKNNDPDLIYFRKAFFDHVSRLYPGPLAKGRQFTVNAGSTPGSKNSTFWGRYIANYLSKFGIMLQMIQAIRPPLHQLFPL